MGIESLSWGEVFTGLVLGLVAVAFALKKFYNGWKAADAEGTVINIMRQELERMAGQNSLLATELSKFQVEIITLNRELHKLNVENQRLHVEVVALTAEVARLQSVLKGGSNVSGTN